MYMLPQYVGGEAETMTLTTATPAFFMLVSDEEPVSWMATIHLFRYL